MTPGWKDEEVNDVLTGKAETYIKEHAINTPDSPLFLYFPLTGPHTPWLPAEQFKGKSSIGPRGDMIMELDSTVGRMIETLKETGLWANTLFLFTSDNGPHSATDEVTRHNHKAAGDLRWQKADIWKGGHRVPLIASWPGIIKGGAVTNQLICLVDLLGTCAEIVGEPLPSHTADDTLSMMPLFKVDKCVRSSVVHHSITRMFSIRKGKWKLIHGKGSGGFGIQSSKDQRIGIPTQGRHEADHSPGQLYNMEEENNLYLTEPEIVTP